MKDLTEYFTPEQFAEMFTRTENLFEGSNEQWIPFANALLEKITAGEAPYLAEDEFSIVMTTCEVLGHLVRTNVRRS